ncbi:MAG: M48 family metalloprotease [Rhodobacteraceae bacterium]|nr:M48 family metalloprotease [Paracoccaceae bacterium]MCY4138068.1 M48 family metalloprotease [Paracoccaceae bacterium]
MKRRPVHLAIATALACTVLAGQVPASGLVRDAEIERTIKLVSEPVLSAAGIDPSSISFFVVNNPEINAFVAGNRNIIINSGLVQKLDGVDMFQAVIAHEVAHITGGHFSQRAIAVNEARTAAGLGMLLGLVAAATGNSTAGIGVAIGAADVAQKGLYAFSRSQESSADRRSIEYLAGAGVNPEAAIEVLELLHRSESLQRSGSARYLRTHPLSATRINRIEELVRRHSGNVVRKDQGITREHQYWYARARAKFKGFLNTPSRNIRELRNADSSEINSLVRAISYFRLPDFDAGLKETERLLRKRPNDPFYNELKGQFLLASGRVRPAIESYDNAVSLAPKEPLLLAGLGRAQLALGNRESNAGALRTLKRAYDLDPRDARMLRDLAIAYQKDGQRGMAALVTAERFALNGQFAQAATHAGHAQKLLRNGSPEWQKARDILQMVGRLK